MKIKIYTDQKLDIKQTLKAYAKYYFKLYGDRALVRIRDWDRRVGIIGL